MTIELFDKDFKNKLGKTIADIEKSSNTEIVLVVKEVSGDYNDAYLIFGSLLSLICFSLLMFLPVVFGDYLIYAGTIITFFIGMILAFFIKPLAKLFIKKDRMNRNVEIMARAHFQKGGIYHTLKKTGMLIYVSLFEQQVFIIADKGIESSIPLDEFKNIKNSFNKAFDKNNISEELLNKIASLKTIFSEYIPPIPDDINELADDMEIIL